MGKLGAENFLREIDGGRAEDEQGVFFKWILTLPALRQIVNIAHAETLPASIRPRVTGL